MSPIIRDLSKATERKDERTGECVLTANINNMEFYNELLLQCACLHFLVHGLASHSSKRHSSAL